MRRRCVRRAARMSVAKVYRMTILPRLLQISVGFLVDSLAKRHNPAWAIPSGNNSFYAAVVLHIRLHLATPRDR
jgi:hypothetical protein